MRVVLDSNVLLAGLATHGICEGLIAIAFRDHTVVLSEHILEEVSEHYVGKFKATPEQTAQAVETLRRLGDMVTPASIPETAFADADDLPVLGAATAGMADYLVTGDKGLLGLARYEKVRIVSPREFYDRLQDG